MSAGNKFSSLLIFPARPILELFNLSNQYAVAQTEAARTQALAAGNALLSIFDGTAWLGILTNIATPGFWILQAGPILLLVSTFTGLAWAFLAGRDFLRLAKNL